MSSAGVSAIVVTYQTGPRLKECLFALAADPDVTEIVIVDNGNPDAMRDWLQAFAEKTNRTVLVSGHGNIGFGAGVNRGIKAAGQPFLLVINPDAVLRWKSLPGMIQLAETLREPWIIGGKIFDLHGREERGGRRKHLTLWRALTRFVGWNTWTLEHTSAPTEPVEMPVISGAFFLTSRQSMAALNGFDEDYFLHVEDVDLCRRCWDAGGVVMYDPRAGVLHYGSTSNASRRFVQSHKADSLARYFRKFARGPLDSLAVAIAVPLMRAAMWVTGR